MPGGFVAPNGWIIELKFGEGHAQVAWSLVQQEVPAEQLAGLLRQHGDDPILAANSLGYVRYILDDTLDDEWAVYNLLVPATEDQAATLARMARHTRGTSVGLARRVGSRFTEDFTVFGPRGASAVALYKIGRT